MEVIKPQQHPLLVDVILDNLFDYCNFVTLNASRKVCTTWCNVSERHWRKKCPTKRLIKSYDSIQNNEDDTWAHSRYNKFLLDSIHFGKNWNTCDNNAIAFWKNHGQVITDLTLENCFITSAKAFRGLLGCVSTPNLESLTLLNVRFSFLRSRKNRSLLPDEKMKNPIKSMRKLKITFSEAFKNLPLPWSVVFEGYHKLQILSLHNYGIGADCELTRVLHGLRSFHINNSNYHPLKILEVGRGARFDDWTPFPHAMLQFFRENIPKPKKLKDASITTEWIKLESLSFSVENPLHSSELHELVAYQSKDLKRLKVLGNVSAGFTSDNILIPTENFTLPYMQNLSRLGLWECPILLNFKFLLACPNLRHLSIISIDTTVQERDRQNPIKDDGSDWGLEDLLLPSLVSFHFNMPINWSTADMQKLSLCMPKISSLSIHASDFSFEGLCQYFTKVKRLLLFNNGLRDHIFTGIPPELAEVAINSRRPNITDLKELEVLGVTRHVYDHIHQNNKSYVCLKQFSATHGLLQMQALNLLYLRTGITRAGRKVLYNNGFGEKMKLCRSRHPEMFLLDFVKNS